MILVVLDKFRRHLIIAFCQGRDFDSDPYQTFSVYQNKDGELEVMTCVSVYHYLREILELDDFCNKFNSTKSDDWDSEYYGVSSDQEKVLKKWQEKYEFKKPYFSDDLFYSFNTYNFEYSNLSSVLQGTLFEMNEQNYVLLQIHGGADVRGGYTDAKMFRLYEPDTLLLDGEGGATIQWKGKEYEIGGENYCFKDDDGNLPKGTEKAMKALLANQFGSACIES